MGRDRDGARGAREHRRARASAERGVVAQSAARGELNRDWKTVECEGARPAWCIVIDDAGDVSAMRSSCRGKRRGVRSMWGATRRDARDRHLAAREPR
jgi:hypothetical protein